MARVRFGGVSSDSQATDSSVRAGGRAPHRTASGHVRPAVLIGVVIIIAGVCALMRFTDLENGRMSAARQAESPSATPAVPAHSIRLMDLYAPTLVGFETRRDRAVPAGPTCDYVATDGTRINMIISRSDEPLDYSSRPTFRRIHVAGHPAVHDPSNANAVAWRSGRYVFVAWTYPATADARTSFERRILPALVDAARWADPRIGHDAD